MTAQVRTDSGQLRIETPVCIIGCGPIGLMGALLLSRHGVPSLLVERRSELNTHPRSRFVDTNTMELLREFGLQETVEATGLGPDWTSHNRWSDNLAVEPYATIASPSFLKAPTPHSPSLPASGRRAPHIWIDQANDESILDWFGSGYVLVLGPACDLDSWTIAVAGQPADAPLTLHQLPPDVAIGPYMEDGMVLVRPDGVIAQVDRCSAGTADFSGISHYLPWLIPEDCD